MSLELDDLWLDKMDRLEGLTLTQKRRLYRIMIVAAAGASYLIDVLLLIAFSLAGTIDPSLPAIYFGLALGHVALFSSLHWKGLTDHLSNPHLTVWQTVYSLGVQILGILIAPQLTQLFLGLVFIIFAFATLRLSLRSTLVIWALSCIAAAVALTGTGQTSIGITDPSTWEAGLVAVAFSTILLRTIALGYYGTALRLRMYEKSRSIEAAATLDALTGCLNRRPALGVISEQIALRRRKGIRTAVLMLDLDHFKAINDRLGHLTGDEVLRQVAGRIRSTLRETDKVGRYGGEEFVVILPATDLTEGKAVAEHIRNGVASMRWPMVDQALWVTLSCGVTEIRPGDTVEDVVGRADAALYEAKHKGRNRVDSAAA